MNVDKELDKMISEMKLTFVDEKKKSPSPNRIIYIVIMMAVVLIACFIFFAYYLESRWPSGAIPQDNTMTVTVPSQPVEAVQSVNEATPPVDTAKEPTEGGREYKSNAIRANFRPGVKPAEPPPDKEANEPIPPAKEAPKGAAY